MTVHLGPDHPCAIYQFWKEWLKADNPAAVLQLDGRHPVKYYNATAANRYRYGLNHGYRASEVSWEVRNLFLDQIHEVNISLGERQGRPMKQNYLDFPTLASTAPQCPDHFSTFIGAFDESDKLLGYISANFCGQLAAASQIIGHGDHLKNGVMLVLWAEFIRVCQDRMIDKIVYSRWSDGTPGLRYWKHSVGMVPRILKQMEHCSTQP